jgi:hypothetical protein
VGPGRAPLHGWVQEGCRQAADSQPGCAVLRCMLCMTWMACTLLSIPLSAPCPSPAHAVAAGIATAAQGSGGGGLPMPADWPPAGMHTCSNKLANEHQRQQQLRAGLSPQRRKQRCTTQPRPVGARKQRPGFPLAERITSHLSRLCAQQAPQHPPPQHAVGQHTCILGRHTARQVCTGVAGRQANRRRRSSCRRASMIWEGGGWAEQAGGRPSSMHSRAGAAQQQSPTWMQQDEPNRLRRLPGAPRF